MICTLNHKRHPYLTGNHLILPQLQKRGRALSPLSHSQVFQRQDTCVPRRTIAGSEELLPVKVCVSVFTRSKIKRKHWSSVYQEATGYIGCSSVGVYTHSHIYMHMRVCVCIHIYRQTNMCACMHAWCSHIYNSKKDIDKSCSVLT